MRVPSDDQLRQQALTRWSQLPRSAVGISNGDTMAFNTTQWTGGYSAFTICGWVKLRTDRNTYSGPFGLWVSSSSYVVMQTTTDGTTLNYETGGAGATAFVRTLVVGQWVFLALVGDGTDAFAYHKIHGSTTLNASVSIPYAGSTTGSPQFGIGQAPWTGEYLDGYYSNFRIWNRALSQGEIFAESMSPVPVRWSNIWAWYPMAHPPSARVDFGPRGNHLTSQGTLPSVSQAPTWPLQKRSGPTGKVPLGPLPMNYQFIRVGGGMGTTERIR